MSGRVLRTAGAIGLAASVCLSTGCAAVWSGQTQQRIATGAAGWSETSSPLHGDSVREIEVAVSGLRAEVSLAAVQRCVVQRMRQVPRTEISWTSYPRWAWGIAAGEAAVAAGAWQLADQNWLGERNAPLLWASAAIAAAAAAVDAVAASGWLSREQTRPAPPLQELEDWRVVHCGRTPIPAAPFAVHGGRADWPGAVDLSGRATLDLLALPERSFPYQTPFAELSCDGCRRVALAIAPEAGAQLVLARRDIDDLDTWLVLHASNGLHPQVAAARKQLLDDQARARQTALRAAQSAYDQGDLGAAAQAVRGCQSLARTPAPACDALGRLIEDRFAQQQLALGRQAVAKGDLDQAEAALYRCTVLDAQRPACGELQQLIAAEREAQARRSQALVDARQSARDTGLRLALRRPCRRPASKACQAAVARCLALSPQHRECLQLDQRIRRVAPR